MGANHSLFLITSRHSFLAEAERIAAGPAAPRILGSGSISDGLAAMRSSATVILLDLDSGQEDGFKTLRKLCEQDQQACVVVASSNRDPDLILEAMRSGAADFLTMPLDRRALADSLDRVIRRAATESSEADGHGRVISFLSAKGGCGATTLAANLAVALCTGASKSERSVILLDLDSPGGDITAMLDIKPVYNIADVAESIHRLDMDLLKSMTVRHGSGLLCLAAAGEGENPGWLSGEQMGTILSFLRRHFDVVMLAGGTTGETEIAAIGQAQIVHLVTTLDFLAVKRARGMLNRLRGLGVPADALQVVLNRIDRWGDVTLHDAREALDAPVVWTVPDDARTAQRAASEGISFTVRGRSRLRSAVLDYASRLILDEDRPASRNGLGALLRKLVPRLTGAPN